MGFYSTVENYLNAVIGRNQEMEKLISAKDISRVISQMSSRDSIIDEAQKEYNPKTHEIMKRRDKTIFDSKGNYQRTEKVWRLPIAYQKYINEISLVFLYGRPVKWTQESEGTDEAFSAFTNLLKYTSFNSKIRQCKRIAGAETQSAMLFRVFRNNEGKPDVQIRVLAKSKGDDVRVRWDQFENIIDIGWGYYLKEGDRTVYHFDIYTSNKIFYCKRILTGWEVKEEENIIGKIPIILFQQDKEWAGVEEMIEREEWIGSRSADTNDYFADPIMYASTSLIKNLPDKKADAKVLAVDGVDDISKAIGLLTWDNAPESKVKEIEWLQSHILTKTFTPQIDFESMTKITNVSAKALKQMMILADIKAAKHKESHDDLLKRTGRLYSAIIGNVLDVSLKSQCDALRLNHEFQEPFGEDIAEVIKNLIDLKDNDIMSQETAVELNPLVKDSRTELGRLKEEKQGKDENERVVNVLEAGL